MIPYSFVISPKLRNKEIVIWTLKTAILSLNLRHVQVSEIENAAFETVHIDYQSFRSFLTHSAFDVSKLSAFIPEFSDEGVILIDGKEDELLTAFYLVNCVQEYQSDKVDALGRFSYAASYQKKFNTITSDFAGLLFERYFNKHFPFPLRNRVIEKSQFFFSHDIDSLYGAFLQDGLAALKQGRFDVIAKLVLNTMFIKPDWFNIDQILKIDTAYNLRATFFWIVNKGRVSKTTTNADYSISSPKIQEVLKNIKNKGCHLGLHKSISTETFEQELQKLGHKVIVNRNHYLRFSIPNHFDEIEKSPLKIDCSLGFAEHYGFRNSLAIPFVPFNLKENKPYHFLEVPLNLMDGTFQKYQQLDAAEVSKTMIDFIERNRSNAVISVLWHNHFFSSFRFKGYFKPYIELLEYVKQNQHQAISPDQLYKKYYFAG